VTECKVQSHDAMTALTNCTSSKLSTSFNTWQ